MVSEEQLEELLLQDEHVLEIRPEEEEWELEEIDYLVKFPNSQKKAKQCVNSLKRFLGYKYMIYDFTDHYGLSRWKTSFETEHGDEAVEYLNADSLRGNAHVGMRGTLEYFERFCDKDLGAKEKNKIKELDDFLQASFVKYDGLDIEEKIIEVKSLKENIYSFLKMLSDTKVD